MGGGTETITGAQVVGLSKKFGTLKKKILLENGKFIAGGMGPVVKARGQSIVDLKSLYNNKYLEAMGYAPSSSTLIEKMSDGKILEYTKNNINSMATYISNPQVNTLGTLDQVILELQDKPDFKRTEMSFTHTDSKKYYYYTSVQNGSYIDISCYLNDEDTVTPYLEDKYPDGYAILDMNTYPIVNNGSVYWKAEVEYIYYEDEEVEGEIVTYQKLGLVTEYIDCIFIYFTVLDEEEAQMYAIAQQHSGPFTTTGTFIREADGESSERTYTVTVYGTFTVTYIGNGEFSFNMNAPVPFLISLDQNQSNAWRNGVVSYQTQKVSQVNQAVLDSVRKLIWDYGVDREDMDGVRRTYALGNIYKSFIVKEYADAYPIITLKRFFQLVNSKNMDLVLKKIGVEGKDFHESIRQPEICDAYLFFGIPFSSSNPGLIQYVFEFFATLANVRENYSKYEQLMGAASIHMSFDGMGILQNYNVDSQVIVKPATRPVRTYWIQEESRIEIVDYEEGGRPIYGTVTYKYYCHQESKDYHIKIIPTYIEYRYILGGEFWGGTNRKGGLRGSTQDGGGISGSTNEYGGVVGSTKDWGGISGGSNNDIELRLPLLKQITNKMDFNLLCDVIEQSMSFAVFTYQKVKMKWYQSGFFKFVIGAILIYFQQYWLFAIMVATEIVMAQWGAKIGGIFQIIVTVVLLVTQNYGAAFEMTAKNILITASQVVSIVSGVNNLLFGIHMEKRQEKYNDILNYQKNQNQKLEEEYDKLHENDGLAVNLFNNVKTLDDISAYYEMSLNNFDSNYLMFEYATDYDKFYKTK